MNANTKTIANYFLKKAEAEGKPLTQMQLQKLVYIAHGYHLAVTDSPLITDEVEAWPFGPVIRSLYEEFLHFGKHEITELAMEYGTGEYPTLPEDDYVIPLLDRVWDVYSGFSGIQLSNKTHEVGTPWSETINDPTNRGMNKPGIPNSRIRDYYKNQMLGQ